MQRLYIPPLTQLSGIQILSAKLPREEWRAMAFGSVKSLTEPPHAQRKNRHWSREMSLESAEARGRVNLIVVVPSTVSALASVMSWLASIGGLARAFANLHGGQIISQDCNGWKIKNPLTIMQPTEELQLNTLQLQLCNL